MKALLNHHITVEIIGRIGDQVVVRLPGGGLRVFPLARLLGCPALETLETLPGVKNG